ncbi:MAG: Methylase [Ilumatobacteraceae bacterium]|nr:Methylase [Ilumatobacteraceae bacterium]
MQLMERNHAVFDDHRVSGEYERVYQAAGQFLDRGEQAALTSIAASVRGRPVLDVGAGTGRLAPLLRLLSDDYQAIDYAPSMVEAFRRSYPGLDVAVGDARDLSRFEPARFGLVVFSNNGIDTVQHDERVQVLREFSRVTAADGRIVFSTLNRNGVSYDESPFQLRRRGAPPRTAAKALARDAVRRVMHPMSWPRSVANWQHARPLARDHGVWAVGPLAAHDFAPFVHFTTLTDLRELIAAAGLVTDTIHTENGEIVPETADDSVADYFTVVAHR